MPADDDDEHGPGTGCRECRFSSLGAWTLLSQFMDEVYSQKHPAPKGGEARAVSFSFPCRALHSTGFAALRGGRTPADAEEDAVLLRFAASSTAAAGGAP